MSCTTSDLIRKQKNLLSPTAEIRVGTASAGIIFAKFAGGEQFFSPSCGEKTAVRMEKIGKIGKKWMDFQEKPKKIKKKA